MKIGKFIADISNSNYQDTLGVKMEVEHFHTQTKFFLREKCSEFPLHETQEICHACLLDALYQ